MDDLTAGPWNFFEDILPPEVTMMVFSHFSLEDVLYVSLVCKTWNTYFDTKHIWKQIYELQFGALSETTVDLTAKLSWKRLFFTMANAQKWKVAFQKMTTQFKFSTPQNQLQYNELSEVRGRSHVLTAGWLILLIDIKVAAKIVARNCSPVTYHYSGQFLPNTDWKKDLNRADLKNKDDKDKLVYHLEKYAYGCTYHEVDHEGRFITRTVSQYCPIWDPSLHLATDKHPPFQHIHQIEANYHRFSLNAKYAIAIGSGMFGVMMFHLHDLSKKCRHCGWHVYNVKTKQYEAESPPCEDQCAFTDLGNEFIACYAVQHNPDKLLLCATEKVPRMSC